MNQRPRLCWRCGRNKKQERIGGKKISQVFFPFFSNIWWIKWTTHGWIANEMDIVGRNPDRSTRSNWQCGKCSGTADHQRGDDVYLEISFPYDSNQIGHHILMANCRRQRLVVYFLGPNWKLLMTELFCGEFHSPSSDQTWILAYFWMDDGLLDLSAALSAGHGPQS